ncbi:MAG: dihydrolipoyllysine-residue acetyltransferase [Melioribacteraceae bacterium]|nr:dihydrolipoyllysine-residue acetyltransferase [Melioribacteraceae bacterium]MCF8356320.1 dihydrolipoyllysine-residue acetyltransferase [Melioribacteraceae bacterium]MCF8394366.1 dihydrolipoyllysine-residue acetyltransferase [Melioribacteraceae bacterium]MCF8420076.1 dihydrolipoyllysine-residue acetyltransferase [Melioribacteraceae bacterium]
MATEFKLPELGENIESADVVKVLISPGDKVEVDQSVIEIETDKATVEVPSEFSGTVKEVKVKDGDNVKVGSVLFTIDESASDAEPAKVEEEEKTTGETEADKVEEEETTTEEAKADKVEEEPEKEEASETGFVEFKMPELGENIDAADVTKVLVKAGDQINVDDPVVEIETDKATVEVPSEVSGTVKEVKIKDGDKAKVGQVIMIVESSGKTKTEKKREEPKPVEKAPEKTEQKDDHLKSESTKERPDDKIISRASSEMPKKIAPAAPSVRRFAREIGIDIHQVNGSGPGGRISIDDVKDFAKTRNEKINKGGVSGAIGISAEPLPDFSKFGKIEREPMNNIRKKTAEHLSYAWATVPHVTQFDKADITGLEKIRKKFGAKVEQSGGKLTVTAILLKVIAGALKKFPQFNCSIDMDKKEIIYKKYYNVGVAVDTERGLLVPVIKNVDKKNIVELSVELGEIAVKARDKKLGLDEMQGGNFSISNLGGIGGTYFTPIVNTPEVAILGVSRAAWEQVYTDGEFQPKFMMPLSLSYDHRIIDGADAIRFLRWVVDTLENPFLLSLEG